MAESLFLMRLMSLSSLFLMSCGMCEYGTYVLIPTRKTRGRVPHSQCELAWNAPLLSTHPYTDMQTYRHTHTQT